MAKLKWKPGNMVYPVPAVMVSCGDREGNKNVLTIAWTGTICSEPAMVYISVRPERHSYKMIKDTGEFVINLTTADLVQQTDFVGVRSGKDIDKYKEMKLTPVKGSLKYAPQIAESPVSIECKVVDIKPLGSHDMFIGKVTAVYVDEKNLDEKGALQLGKADLIAYSHGEYYKLGKKLGKFGFSVKKKSKSSRKR